MSWLKRLKAKAEMNVSPNLEQPRNAREQRLREFAYLDEVSVQSLLASLVGALPSEVTELSSRSREAEISGTAGTSAPLLAKAELTARFTGGSSNGSQLLSRAVAESLFKNLYDLVEVRLNRSVSESASEQVDLKRGALIEIEVELAADPIYRFNATMGVLSDLADAYPALLENRETAMILDEAGPINKVLERMLVGLIPLKSKATHLRAGTVDGKTVAADEAFFKNLDIASEAIHIVGVTEQEKYWRDVRRVLFTNSRFTILGRIGRSGIQPDWTPVKLTEVMREIAPQFPDAITKVGNIGYSTPVNVRQEANEAALETALVSYGLSIGGEAAASRSSEIAAFAMELRGEAATIMQQAKAFDRIGARLIESGILDSIPENARAARIAARTSSGLRSNTAAKSLADFASASETPVVAPEKLIDLEIIAIYW